MVKAMKRRLKLRADKDFALANEHFGDVKANFHIAGYAFERGCQRLRRLLADDSWRECGDGFDDVDSFLKSLQLEQFAKITEEKREIAKLIRGLRPEVSNRAVARALKVDESTLRENPARKAKRANKNNERLRENPAPSAPREISGGRAAKIVERRTTDISATQARRADNEQRLGAKIAALPEAKFGVIVADPEWHDEVYSEETGMNRHASRIYTTSGIEDIKQRPVWSIAADDSVLFLWSTNQHLDVAIDVLRAWGFEYASHYIWRKPTVGLGYWNRSVHEVLLIGTRGNPPCPALGTQKESVLDADRGDVHSAKPEIFLEMIEGYFPTVPKIELNRRGPARPGWSAWGNEAADSEAAA